jgi:hypothetical protein
MSPPSGSPAPLLVYLDCLNQYISTLRTGETATTRPHYQPGSELQPEWNLSGDTFASPSEFHSTGEDSPSLNLDLPVIEAGAPFPMSVEHRWSQLPPLIWTLSIPVVWGACK